MTRAILSTLLVLLLAPLALAQPFLPPQAPPGYDLSDKELDTVRVVGIQAGSSHGGTPEMDDTLQSFAQLLRGMSEYDTFHLVSDATTKVTRGEETAIPIDARYALNVITGMGSDPKQRNLAVRITLDGNADAIRAQGVTSPGKTIVFRGMERDPGELIVLLQLLKDKKDDNEQGDDSEQGDQQEEQNQDEQQSRGKDREDNQAQDQESKDKQDDAQQQEQQQQLAPADDKEKQDAGAEKKDTANVEALLQSLEEVDRREQLNMLNQNKRFPKIHGDWW